MFTISIRYLTLTCITAFFLFSCGGSSPQKSIVQNTAPIAVAGQAITVNEVNRVNFDGSASSDSDGKIVRYQWEQTSGLSLTVFESDSAFGYIDVPDITEDADFIFELTVTDDDGASAKSQLTVSVVDTHSAPNDFIIKRLSSPGRIEISWAEKEGVNYNLYMAKEAGVNAINYLTLSQGKVLENVSSPLTLPAAYNDYLNTYFSIASNDGGNVRSSKNKSTVVKQISNGCQMSEAGVICSDAYPPKDTENSSYLSPQCVLQGDDPICWGYVYTNIELTNPIMIDSSDWYWCAIDDTGVVCNGLGDNFNDIPVLNNPNYVSVSHGIACAIDDNGLHCWGGGVGWSNDELLNVPNISSPKQVEMSSDHACAISDNEVVCWGNNADGQTDVPQLNNPLKIEVIRSNSCAMEASRVVCWGKDFGSGTEVLSNLSNPFDLSINTDLYTTPGTIDTLGGQGKPYVCALDESGLVCSKQIKKELPELSTPSTVVIAGDVGCAIEDNFAMCWGDNGLHQTQLNKFQNVASFGFGNDGSHGCALHDSTISCWGANDYGQSDVPELDNPTALKVGQGYTCAIDNNGISCWGKRDIATLTPSIANATFSKTDASVVCVNNTEDILCWNPYSVMFSANSTTTDGFDNIVIESGRGWYAEGLGVVKVYDDSIQVTVYNHLKLIAFEWERFFDINLPNIKSFYDNYSNNAEPCIVNDKGVSCVNLGQEVTLQLTDSAKFVTSSNTNYCLIDDYGLLCWGDNYFKGFGYRATPIY